MAEVAIAFETMDKHRKQALAYYHRNKESRQAYQRDYKRRKMQEKRAAKAVITSV